MITTIVVVAIALVVGTNIGMVLERWRHARSHFGKLEARHKCAMERVESSLGQDRRKRW